MLSLCRRIMLNYATKNKKMKNKKRLTMKLSFMEHMFESNIQQKIGPQWKGKTTMKKMKKKDWNMSFCFRSFWVVYAERIKTAKTRKREEKLTLTIYIAWEFICRDELCNSSKKCTAASITTEARILSRVFSRREFHFLKRNALSPCVPWSNSSTTILVTSDSFPIF